MTYLLPAICVVELLVAAVAWYGAVDAARRLVPAGAIADPRFLPQLIIAATGRLPGLEALRRALAAQTVPIASLCFAVEDADDPAFRRIAAVFRDFDPPVTILTAGLATAGGQKSRNLVAALGQVDDDRPVILADADIVPQPDWLATLLRPIRNGRADIATGYRWPLPLEGNVPTLLVTWIDRAIAALPKIVCGQLIWGGSVALAPGLCTRLALRACLEAHVSDDLFMARLARRERLRVVFPTGALLPSPMRHDWRSMFDFGRRQYQMIRMYSPLAYGAALAATALNLLGTAVPLALIGRAWWAAPCYAAMVALSLLTLWARNRLGAAAGISAEAGGGRPRLWPICLALPLVHLIHLLFIVGAAHVRTIRWGRCTYRMAGRRVVSIERGPMR